MYTHQIHFQGVYKGPIGDIPWNYHRQHHPGAVRTSYNNNQGKPPSPTKYAYNNGKPSPPPKYDSAWRIPQKPCPPDQNEIATQAFNSGAIPKRVMNNTFAVYSPWSTEACDGSIHSYMSGQEIKSNEYKPSWTERLPTTNIDNVHWPDTLNEAERNKHGSHIHGVHLPGIPTAGLEPANLIVEASSNEKVNLSSSRDVHYDKVDDSAVVPIQVNNHNAPKSLPRLPRSSFETLSAVAKKVVCLFI